jgi:hypothetical protein
MEAEAASPSSVVGMLSSVLLSLVWPVRVLYLVLLRPALVVLYIVAWPFVSLLRFVYAVVSLPFVIALKFSVSLMSLGIR